MMNPFCCIEDSITINDLNYNQSLNFCIFLWYIGEPFFLHNVNVFIEKQLSSQKLVA